MPLTIPFPPPLFFLFVFSLYFLLPSLLGLFVLTPYPCYPSGRPISTISVPSRQSDSLFAVKAASATLIVVAIPTGGPYGGVTLRPTLSKCCGALVIIISLQSSIVKVT